MFCFVLSCFFFNLLSVLYFFFFLFNVNLVKQIDRLNLIVVVVVVIVAAVVVVVVVDVVVADAAYQCFYCYCYCRCWRMKKKSYWQTTINELFTELVVSKSEKKKNDALLLSINLNQIIRWFDIWIAISTKKTKYFCIYKLYD